MKQFLFSTLLLMTMTAAAYASGYADKCNTGTNKDAADTSSTTTTDDRDNADQRTTEE